MNRLWQLTIADFRERSRRYSFLLTLLGVLFFGYLVITDKYTVRFGDYRPVYDSAWAGSLMALCSTVTLSIVGFYLVRGSIQRDVQTRVGQIIAANPIRNATYLVSKFLSNFLVLSVIVAVLAVVAFLTLIFKNEHEAIDIGAFLIPFAVVALPALSFVAALAVLFDTVRPLQGALGNIIYFFLAEFFVVLGIFNVPLVDLAGISLITDSAQAAAAAAFPTGKTGLVMGYVSVDPVMSSVIPQTFSWQGVGWTSGAVFIRLFWLGAALVVVGIAVPLFDRFDSTMVTKGGKPKKKASHAKADPAQETTSAVAVKYERLSNDRKRSRFYSLILAEFTLAFKGRHWLWWAVAVGLVVAQAAAPYEIARHFLVAGSMIWPITIWSSMGTREKRFNTGPLIFGLPNALMVQLPAVWTVGAVVALVSVGPMSVRGLINGDILYSLSLLVGAMLIPSVALALGVVSGGRKLFEVIYFVVWYIGSVDQLAPIDVLSTTTAATTPKKPAIMLVILLGMLITAIASRRYQIRHAQ